MPILKIMTVIDEKYKLLKEKVFKLLPGSLLFLSESGGRLHLLEH